MTWTIFLMFHCEAKRFTYNLVFKVISKPMSRTWPYQIITKMFPSLKTNLLFWFHEDNYVNFYTFLLLLSSPFQHFEFFFLHLHLWGRAFRLGFATSQTVHVISNTKTAWHDQECKEPQVSILNIVLLDGRVGWVKCWWSVRDCERWRKDGAQKRKRLENNECALIEGRDTRR